LYEIQQQQQQQINCKLLQTFPQEHPSSNWISSLLQINPNTLVSSSYSDSYSNRNSIVIWSKSKSKSSSSSSSLEYEPVQRIAREEAGRGIQRLVLIKQNKEEEEVFASCSYLDHSVLIWTRRGKGGKGDKFQIKQKITNLKDVDRLLYISQTNELIFASSPSLLLQIWSSSSSSDFVERQKIQTSSCIHSLCQLNDSNRNRIEFASSHRNGQIMIWSKQEINYSLCKTLQPFNHSVYDIIFISDNEGFNHFLIACSCQENKIVIYKGEEKEEEELEHKDVFRLIPMSNGQFASGGENECLNIWLPSFSSSLSSF
jgi:WD40 repeat protein